MALRMRFLRIVLFFLIAGPFVLGSPVFCQTPAMAPRVVDRIDESQLITLKGKHASGCNGPE